MASGMSNQSALGLTNVRPHHHGTKYLCIDLISFVLGTVYDDSCNAVDGLVTDENPCTQATFGCSPPPIRFNKYTNTFNHKQ